MGRVFAHDARPAQGVCLSSEPRRTLAEPGGEAHEAERRVGIHLNPYLQDLRSTSAIERHDISSLRVFISGALRSRARSFKSASASAPPSPPGRRGPRVQAGQAVLVRKRRDWAACGSRRWTAQVMQPPRTNISSVAVKCRFRLSSKNGTPLSCWPDRIPPGLDSSIQLKLILMLIVSLSRSNLWYWNERPSSSVPWATVVEWPGRAPCPGLS